MKRVACITALYLFLMLFSACANPFDAFPQPYLPAASPSPKPEATHSPKPVATQSPTPRPTFTPIPRPTSEPTSSPRSTPTSSPSPSPTPTPSSAPIPFPSTYTVQSGDSLWAIAQRFGVSVCGLAAANNITNPSLIYTGQVLVIPDSTHNSADCLSITAPLKSPQPSPPSSAPKLCDSVFTVSVLSPELTGLVDQAIAQYTSIFGCQKFVYSDDHPGITVRIGLMDNIGNGRWIAAIILNYEPPKEVIVNEKCWGIVQYAWTTIAHELGHVLGWRDLDGHPFMTSSVPSGAYVGENLVIMC